MNNELSETMLHTWIRIHLILQMSSYFSFKRCYQKRLQKSNSFRAELLWFFSSLQMSNLQRKWLYTIVKKGMEKLGHTYVNTIKRHWEVINHFWISLWSSLEYETEIQLQLQCSKYKYPFNWVKYLEWLFNIQSLAFQVKKKTSLRAYHKHHGTQERTDSNISTRLNRASHQIFAHK